MGGVLSVMDGGMQTEFCHHCDLKQCGTSRNPHCEFHVHIEGNAKYFLALYGVTDQEAVDGATISLVYHPPRGCRQVIDCDEAEDPCTRVALADMPWFPVRAGRMPWFECIKSFAADMLKMEVGRGRLTVSKPVLKLESAYGFSA
jgi:hypothetical protein